MIALTSNGLTSETLLHKMRAHINGGKAALIVTADNEYKAENYHVPHLKSELEALGLSVDCFDFDTQSPSELMQYDAAEMIGGNPYYLLDSIRRHNFASALREFAENRCLIGCSAGSLVITPSLGIIDIYSPEMNFVGLNDLTALNLIDVHILPHYSKFITRYEAFEEKCAAYEAKIGCSVIRISDGDAVLINDGIREIVRS